MGTGLFKKIFFVSCLLPVRPEPVWGLQIDFSATLHEPCGKVFFQTWNRRWPVGSKIGQQAQVATLLLRRDLLPHYVEPGSLSFTLLEGMG